MSLTLLDLEPVRSTLILRLKMSISKKKPDQNLPLLSVKAELLLFLFNLIAPHPLTFLWHEVPDMIGASHRCEVQTVSPPTLRRSLAYSR